MECNFTLTRAILFLISLIIAHQSRVNNVVSAVDPYSEENHSTSIRAGGERYATILRDSRMPRYGQCWKSALERLESGCKELTDELQHRMALNFANCFLMATGRKQYSCDEDMSIADCTKDMEMEGYIAYNEHFTHTHNMCYFLQSQVWQEQTDFTIERLSHTSKEAVEKIESSNEIQNEVLKKQSESLENQQKFIEKGIELKHLLEDSSSSVSEMLQEFKDSTSEQRDLLFEVFEKLSVLQSVVLGEFTGFYSLLFYTLSILICYVLTSTPRTCGSRFWLFLVMTCNILTERCLAYLGAAKDISTDGIDENTIVYSRLWWCRKTFTSIAIIVWLYFACTFKDLNKINNQLLEQIRKQNSDLKRLLQVSGKNGVTDQSTSLLDTTHVPKIIKTLTVEQGKINARNQIPKETINSSTGYESDSDYTSENDSNATDRTYIYPDADVSESESCSSFFTTSTLSRMSRESTPMLREELRDIRSATPLREMTPIPGVTIADTSFNTTSANSSLNSTISNSRNSTGSIRRGPGRPKGSGRRSAPVLPSEVPVTQYNLRSRKRPPTITENPLVHKESEHEFSKLVRHLSGVSNRNAAKVNATVDRLTLP